jgi:hypothetical protein
MEKRCAKGGPPSWGPPCGIPSTMTGQSQPQNNYGRQRPESTLQPTRASALLRRVTGISRRAAPVEAQLQRSKLSYQTGAQLQRVRFGEEAQWNEFAFALVRKQMIWNLRRRSGSEARSKDNASLLRRVAFAGTSVRPGKEAHRNLRCLCASFVTFLRDQKVTPRRVPARRRRKGR